MTDNKPTPAQSQVAVPREFSERNLPHGHIGYYNGNRYPVTFTSAFSQRGETTIQPSEAVKGMAGELVRYDPDLERQVADKVLSRIVPRDAHFKRFERENLIASGEAAVPIVASPIIRTGSKDTLEEANALKYETEEVDGVTHYLYNGQRFTSLTGLTAFARQSKSAKP